MGGKQIRFDGTVTFGNLLTLISMLGSIAAMWVNFQTRLVVLEERSRVQESAITKMVDVVQKVAITQAEVTTLIKEQAK